LPAPAPAVDDAAPAVRPKIRYDYNTRGCGPIGLALLLQDNLTATRTDPPGFLIHDPLLLQDNLITRVHITQNLIHDISFQGTEQGSVVSQSRGQNLAMDHHRGKPAGGLHASSCSHERGSHRTPQPLVASHCTPRPLVASLSAGLQPSRPASCAAGAPYAILWTDIDVGTGQRPFFSSGFITQGMHSGKPQAASTTA
jgi:hypothetical protein